MTTDTNIQELVSTNDLEALTAWLEETGTLDIAEEIARLDPADRAVPFRLLDKARALAVFESLDPIHQQELLEGLREQRVRELIEGMQPDDRARLLHEMPAKVAARLQAGLSPEERQQTAELLGYPPESAGRVMSPQYVNVRASMTAADALAKIRRTGSRAETLQVIPVTDDQRRIVGVIDLRDLVVAEPGTRVSDLITADLYQVTVDTDQEIAARLIQEADLLALSVVDTEDRLVGVITVDDAMEILEAETTEDIVRSGGSEPLGRPYMSASTLFLARKRAVWLLLLIVAAALTVSVLDYFEETLEAVVTLALFIPLLIDTGGNSGSQAATVIIRAMAVGEVRFSDLGIIAWRELRVGLLLGVMLSVVGFFPVWAIFGADFATVISLTLVLMCVWATFWGSLLPMVADRLGFDPAVVSAPVITTFVDATGLMIYFLLANAILADRFTEAQTLAMSLGL